MAKCRRMHWWFYRFVLLIVHFFRCANVEEDCDMTNREIRDHKAQGLVRFLRQNITKIMRPSVSLTTVLDSQYVSETLSESQVLQIKQLYSHYHKLAVCYGWAYKRLRKTAVALKMTSTVLTVVGAAMTPLSLITLVVSGVGVCVRAYSDARNLASKVQRYSFTHTLYLKVLDYLISYLRGLP